MASCFHRHVAAHGRDQGAGAVAGNSVSVFRHERSGSGILLDLERMAREILRRVELQKDLAIRSTDLQYVAALQDGLGYAAAVSEISRGRNCRWEQDLRWCWSALPDR